MTYRIRTFNNIARKGLDCFSDEFTVCDNIDNPDALLLRSFNLHEHTIEKSVRVIARAGAGTNNIPVEKMTSLGIPVLNTPGANANAVKELVITGMLLACRKICAAWDFTKSLTGDNETLSKNVEQSKKQFKGMELPGRTLGIIGLGNIGVKLANSAIALGMNVIGYDPQISVENAWQMSSQVQHAHSMMDVIKHADFISVHVPLNDHTRDLLNKDNMSELKAGAVLLNFARGGIINRDALSALLRDKKISCYVTDFPSNELRDFDNVISLPHLGASTVEAEENCAVMAANQVQAFLKTGEIKNAVNYPNVSLNLTGAPRVAIFNDNVPNMVAQISKVLSGHDINIVDMINKSRNDAAYTLIDTDKAINDTIIKALNHIDGVAQVFCPE